MTGQDDKDMSREEMEKVLCEQDVGVLCLSRGDEPYGVTVSYALLEGEIVLHCAVKGRKLDFIRANPQACFVVSRHPEPSTPHHPDEECNFRYESVVCRGSARIVEEPQERFEYLKKFKAHFDRKLGLDPQKGQPSEASAGKIGIIAIALEGMTGRKNG